MVQGFGLGCVKSRIDSLNAETDCKWLTSSLPYHYPSRIVSVGKYSCNFSIWGWKLYPLLFSLRHLLFWQAQAMCRFSATRGVAGVFIIYGLELSNCLSNLLRAGQPVSALVTSCYSLKSILRLQACTLGLGQVWSCQHWNVTLSSSEVWVGFQGSHLWDSSSLVHSLLCSAVMGTELSHWFCAVCSVPHHR